MPRRRRRDKKQEKEIALHRIHYLFKLAEKTALEGRLAFADRYVQLARKISMRYLVSIPVEYKRCFCKHCYHYFLPNVTGRVRVRQGKIIWYCTYCNRFSRMPLKAKKQE